MYRSRHVLKSTALYWNWHVPKVTYNPSVIVVCLHFTTFFIHFHCSASIPYHGQRANWLYWEHSLLGTKVPGNIRFQERKFPGTFVPGSEGSHWEGAKLPGSEKSRYYSFPRPFVPWNFRSRYPGPFLPYLVHLQRRSSITNRGIGLWQRPCTATTHKQ